MMKKKIITLLRSVAAIILISVASGSLFVSCGKDYDDDLKNTSSEFGTHKAAVEQALKDHTAAVDSQIALLKSAIEVGDATNKTQIENILSRLAEHKTTLNQLTSDLNSANVRVSQVETSLAVVNQNLAKISGEINKIDARLNTLDARVLATEMSINGLKKQLENILTITEQLKGKDADLEKAISAAEKSAYDKAMAALALQEKELTSQISLLEKELENVTELYKQDIAIANKAIAELQTKVNEQITLFSQNIANLSSEIDTIKGRIDGLDGLVDGLVSSVGGLETQFEELYNDLNLYTEYVDQAFQNLAMGISFVNDKVTIIEGEVKKIITSIEETNGEVTSIKELIVGIDGKITTIDGQITDINGKILDINGDITDIQGSVTTANGQIADIISDMADEKARVNAAIAAANTAAANAAAAAADAKTTAAEELAKEMKKAAENLAAEMLTVDGKFKAMETEYLAAIQQCATDAAAAANKANAELEDKLNGTGGVIPSLNDKLTKDITDQYTKITGEYQAEIKAVTDRLDTVENEITSIKANITSLREDVDALIARIQSITFVPETASGKGIFDVANGVTTAELEYVIDAKNASGVVTELLAAYTMDNKTFSILVSKVIQTKALIDPAKDFTITGVTAGSTTNSIKVSITYTGDPLYDGVIGEFNNPVDVAATEYSIALKITHKDNSKTSAFTNMSATVVVKPINEDLIFSFMNPSHPEGCVFYEMPTLTQIKDVNSAAGSGHVMVPKNEEIDLSTLLQGSIYTVPVTISNYVLEGIYTPDGNPISENYGLSISKAGVLNTGSFGARTIKVVVRVEGEDKDNSTAFAKKGYIVLVLDLSSIKPAVEIELNPADPSFSKEIHLANNANLTNWSKLGDDEIAQVVGGKCHRVAAFLSIPEHTLTATVHKVYKEEQDLIDLTGFEILFKSDTHNFQISTPDLSELEGTHTVIIELVVTNIADNTVASTMYFACRAKGTKAPVLSPPSNLI